LGRFLQEDVCQGDGLNLYAYCRNNPVVYYDPSGYGSAGAKLGTYRDPENPNNETITTSTCP
ncbi:MAG: hypothetical protein HFI17_17930, partial [Lachnospiraceae bacterium]|nr:hypothetical protein [Lachnospiraceae bacterium]